MYNGAEGGGAKSMFSSGRHNLSGPTDFVKQNYYQPTVAPYALPNGGTGKPAGEPDNTWDFTDFYGPNSVQKGETRPQESYDTPDAYSGSNYWMRSVWISIITADEAYPVTEVLPWMPADSFMTYSWNKWKFEDALPVRNPEEATNRVIRSNQTEGSGEMQRYGIGLQTEYGFWKMPMGRIHYALGQQQMKNAIVEGQCLGVIEALLGVPRVYDSANDVAKKRLTLSQYEQLIQEDVNNWGAVHKDKNGWDMLYDRLRSNLAERGVPNSDYTIVPRGLQKYIQNRPENNNFWTNGVGRKNIELNGPYGRVRESRAYRVGDGKLPYDPNFRTRSIGSYVLMNDELLKNIPNERYKTPMRDIRLFSVNDDVFTPMTIQTAFRNCGLFDFRRHRDPGADTGPDSAVGNPHSRKRVATSELVPSDASFPLTALGKDYFGSYPDFLTFLDKANCYDHLQQKLYSDNDARTKFYRIFGGSDATIGTTESRSGRTTHSLADAARTVLDDVKEDPNEMVDSTTPLDGQRDSAVQRGNPDAELVYDVYGKVLNNSIQKPFRAFDHARKIINQVLGDQDITPEELSINRFSELRATLRAIVMLRRVNEIFKTMPVLTAVMSMLLVEEAGFEAMKAYWLTQGTIDQQTAIKFVDSGLPVWRKSMPKLTATRKPQAGEQSILHFVPSLQTPAFSIVTYLLPDAKHDEKLSEVLSGTGTVPKNYSATDACNAATALRNRVFSTGVDAIEAFKKFVTNFLSNGSIFKLDKDSGTLVISSEYAADSASTILKKNTTLAAEYNAWKAAMPELYRLRGQQSSELLSLIPEAYRDVQVLIHRAFEGEGRDEPFALSLEDWDRKYVAVNEILKQTQEINHNSGPEDQEAVEETGMNVVSGPFSRLHPGHGRYYGAFQKYFAPLVESVVDRPHLQKFNTLMAPYFEGFAATHFEFKGQGDTPSNLQVVKDCFVLWITILYNTQTFTGSPSERYAQRQRWWDVVRQVAFSQEGEAWLVGMIHDMGGVSERNRPEFNEAFYRHKTAIEEAVRLNMRDIMREQQTEVNEAVETMKGQPHPTNLNPTAFGDALRKLLRNTTINDARQLVFFLEHDLRFPLGFILFRPHERYRMGTVIHMVAGSVTGNTLFGHLDTMRGANVAQKMHLVNVTFYAKNVIWESKNIVRAENVLCAGYDGGAGRVVYEHTVRTRELYQNGKATNDIFVVATPLGWTPAQPYLDIVGKVDPSIVNNISDKASPHYPSAEFYCNYWGWKHPSGSDFNSFFDHLGATASQRYNTVCLPGAAIHWHDGKQTWSLHSISQGHWGQDVSPGVARVYKGLQMDIKPVNYTQLAVVGVVAV